MGLSRPRRGQRDAAVTCSDAFPFFPDPDRALAEMCRVLRPGGRAVIDMSPTVPEGTGSHRMRGPGGEGWAWNDADVRRMMEAAGFDDVAITHVPGTGTQRPEPTGLRDGRGDDRRGREASVGATAPGSTPGAPLRLGGWGAHRASGGRLGVPFS